MKQNTIIDVQNALKHGKCFSRGNYCVSSHSCSEDGFNAQVFYYGHCVFSYSHHPKIHPDKSIYDFCGYEGYSKTAKLINKCLEAVGEKYRVKTVNGKVVEVQLKK